MTLAIPSEAEAQLQPSAVFEWVAAWQSWRGPGEVVWCERRWRTLGVQKVPECLVLASAGCIARWIGEDVRWSNARRRYEALIARWPELTERLPLHYDALADYADDDMRRLEAVVSWLRAHPQSNLYPRQLPVAGVNTKWFESRLPLIADLLAVLQGDETPSLSLHRRCGLKEVPYTVRFRLLDRALRQRLGGMGDIEARIDDISALRLPASKVFIVENLQTGLAFEDYANAAVFMRLGYGVSVLAGVPWACQAQCIYWGDIDTHGFAILNRARACLPRVTSALMDEATLLLYRELWGEEKDQYSGTAPHLLTPSEALVYTGLKQQRWGQNVRLEQERIAWDQARAALQAESG